MHKVPDQMYAAHKALNYKMTEKRKYKQKMFMEQANRHRENISRNWYAVRKEGQDVSSDSRADKKSEAV